ncbi:hypothetical protein BHE90_000517 [Fusarium euwallaceae]|uniref:Nephrocystin 3-like N-terminal domain-containing protein n=1 Tax=Fusarium euwallaceae TaxID=1147111 RepID=A0A430MAI2_9HYPO|nr:hypothetical protein BHE90_000517 [Fusarium euwallaceae]
MPPNRQNSFKEGFEKRLENLQSLQRTGAGPTQSVDSRDLQHSNIAAQLYGDQTVNTTQNIYHSETPRDACLKFLQDLAQSGDDPSCHLEKLRRTKTVAGGTCEWFLKAAEFKSWFEGDKQILWVEGEPGTGKTTLSIFLVDFFEKTGKGGPGNVSPENGQTLAFYFCDFQDPRTNTRESIIRGLLRRLLDRHSALFQEAHGIFSHSPTALQGNADALWTIFRKILCKLALHFRNVHLLVDALEECDETSGRDLIKSFHDDIKRERIPGNVKLLITSQDIEWIKNEFEDDSVIALRLVPSKIAGDVEKAIKEKAEKLSRRKYLQEEDRKKLEANLIKYSEGKFLWADLIINHIDEELDTSDLRWENIRDKIPLTLDGFYDRNVRKSWFKDPHLVKFVLQLAVASRRPLTAKEFDMAYAILKSSHEDRRIPDLNQKKRGVYRICKPVLTHDSETDTVKFVHQSARRYLVSFRLPPDLTALSCTETSRVWSLVAIEYWQYLTSILTRGHPRPSEPCLIDHGNANYVLLKTCLAYLGRDEFDRGQKIISYGPNHTLVPVFDKLSMEEPQHCFLRYSIEYWREHALAVDWTALVGQTDDFPDLADLPTLRDSLFLYAAGSGYEKTAMSLHNRYGARLDARDEGGRTALHLAAFNGHTTTVQFLIKHGAECGSRDVVSATPLHWAARGGHEETFSYLLSVLQTEQNRASPQDTRVQKWKKLLRSALDSPGPVVDLDMPDKSGKTLLVWAIEGGSESLVRTLLEKGVKNEYSLDEIIKLTEATAAIPAAFKGWSDLDALVDFSEQLDWLGDILDIPPDIHEQRTPLSRAAEQGQQGIVKLLLQHGAQPNFKDEQGHTAMFWAAKRNHKAVVDMLKSEGADIEPQLWLAIKKMKIRAVQNLIEIGGADLNRRDMADSKLSAPGIAALAGSKRIMELVVQGGEADLGLTTKRGLTPLSLAAIFGNSAAVSILIGTGNAIADWRDELGLTPLNWAVLLGHTAVIRSIVETGKADVNSRNKPGETNLMLAARMGYEEGFRVLFEDGSANPSITDSLGRTALFNAIRGGNRVIIDKLLCHPHVSKTRPDIFGATPLSIAARGNDRSAGHHRQLQQNSSVLGGVDGPRIDKKALG